MKTLYIRVLAAAVALSLAASTLASAVTMPVSVIGNPGNANDTANGNVNDIYYSKHYFGSVGYTYAIGTDDVTISQYTEFLNAVAQTDTYSLYNTNMMYIGNSSLQLTGAGILRSGSSGNYSYSVMGNSGNLPIVYVSWFDCARFCNWLQNGQPTSHLENPATTEDGAYTILGAMSGNSITRNGSAHWWIPTEDEWYKAAYYDPTLNGGAGGYWTYGTQSNTAPGNVIGGGSNQANYEAYTGSNYTYSVTQSPAYSGTQNYLTDVGSFSNSKSYYGVYDMTGDVFNINDTMIHGARGGRGGSWRTYSDFIARSHCDNIAPTASTDETGFRIASAVPEPNAGILTGIGSLIISAMRRPRSSCRNSDKRLFGTP